MGTVGQVAVEQDFVAGSQPQHVHYVHESEFVHVRAVAVGMAGESDFEGVSVVHPDFDDPVVGLAAAQHARAVVLHVAAQAGDAPGQRSVHLAPVAGELLARQAVLAFDGHQQVDHDEAPSKAPDSTSRMKRTRSPK